MSSNCKVETLKLYVVGAKVNFPFPDKKARAKILVFFDEIINILVGFLLTFTEFESNSTAQCRKRYKQEKIPFYPSVEDSLLSSPSIKI